MRERLAGITDQLADKAMKVIVFANEKSGSSLHPLLTVSKRIVMDTVIVHPATIAVDTRERLQTLHTIGLNDAQICGIVVGHFLLDYTGPSLCIPLVYPVIQSLTGLPPLENMGISIAAARSVYGLGIGLVRETVYSFLPKLPKQ